MLCGFLLSYRECVCVCVCVLCVTILLDGSLDVVQVKKDVEHEMAQKIEIQVNCPLSLRQRRLYRALRDKLNVGDLLNIESADNIMNLIMQFRKVCLLVDIAQDAQIKF
jgi:SNF2 family DNA or RNA helicase